MLFLLFSCSEQLQQIIEFTDLNQVKNKVSLRHRSGVLRRATCLQVCFLGHPLSVARRKQNELLGDELFETDSFVSGTRTRFGRQTLTFLMPSSGLDTELSKPFFLLMTFHSSAKVLSCSRGLVPLAWKYWNTADSLTVP